MYRLVVDTNVIVSAVIGTGKPRQFLLEGLLGGKYALVTSDAIISEMREVLGRPKFSLDNSEINEAMSILNRCPMSLKQSQNSRW